MSSTTGAGEYLPKCLTCEVRNFCDHWRERRANRPDQEKPWPDAKADMAAAGEEG